MTTQSLTESQALRALLLAALRADRTVRDVADEVLVTGRLPEDEASTPAG